MSSILLLLVITALAKGQYLIKTEGNKNSQIKVINWFQVIKILSDGSEYLAETEVDSPEAEGKDFSLPPGGGVRLPDGYNNQSSKDKGKYNDWVLGGDKETFPGKESPAEKVAGLFKNIKTWPVPDNVNPGKKAKLMKMKAELMKCEIKILSALENHKM